MKIGLSFSRCVRDLVDGVVDIRDVLVIISRTDFDPTNDDQWKGIWEGYRSINPEWYGYSDEAEGTFRSIATILYESGKLHQPRQFGARPQRLPYYWLEASLPASELESRPAVKKAWEQFQVVAGLATSKPLINDNF